MHSPAAYMHGAPGPKVRPLLGLLNMQSLPPIGQLKAAADAALGDRREVIAREAMQLNQLQSNASQKRCAIASNICKPLVMEWHGVHQVHGDGVARCSLHTVTSSTIGVHHSDGSTCWARSSTSTLQQ